MYPVFVKNIKVLTNHQEKEICSFNKSAELRMLMEPAGNQRLNEKKTSKKMLIAFKGKSCVVSLLLDK